MPTIETRRRRPAGTPPVERLLLTPEEAAHALNVGRSTVYDLMRFGLLRSVKIGKARRIPTGSLRAYIEQLTAEDFS